MIAPPLTAVTILLAALLVACGGGDDPVRSPQPSADGEPVRVTNASVTNSLAIPDATDDPALSGPYGVGFVQLTLLRSDSLTGELRELPTVLWYPTNEPGDFDPTFAATDRAPLAEGAQSRQLIVFSHGAGGSPTNATYLTAHLATHGFLVAAPAHTGHTTGCDLNCFANPNVIAAARANRPDDIRFVVQELRRLSADPASFLFAAVSDAPVGVTGHSFGGLTALTTAVQTPDEIGAAVAFAPALDDTLLQSLPGNPVPVMIMGGERDLVTPVQIQRDLFALAQPPRALVVFDRGGHFIFSRACPPTIGSCFGGPIAQDLAHIIINRLATAFFRRYLLNEIEQEAWLTANSTDTEATLTFDP